jgi:Flp pilus assembly protein TadG
MKHPKLIPMNHEGGQSLVELGVSLTFLFILLAGVVDIGRAFFTYISLRDAAQEGALYASFEETKCQDTQARVKTAANEIGELIDSGQVAFSCQVIGPACGDRDSANSGAVRVTLTYGEFPLTMPFLGTLLGGQTIAIRASSTDNILKPLCDTSLP